MGVPYNATADLLERNLRHGDRLEFVDSLPKTATGKIQRFKLRAR